MPDPSAVDVPNWIEWLVAAIVALLGKLGYDQTRKRPALERAEDEEVTLDSKITRRDSVMIWMTERFHKYRDEVNVPILANRAAIEELKLRITRAETDISQSKAEINDRISRVHEHIESSAERLEKKIDEYRADTRSQFDRIWNRLDQK